MSAPPVKKTVANCLKKRRHNDELTARAYGSQVVKERHLRCLWIYQCPHCHGWHLTSVPHRDQWKVTADETFQPAAD